MDDIERALLSSYAKAELIGGLILGEFARRTEDPLLRDKLIHHSAEEIRHAAYFTDLLTAYGGSLFVRDTEGNHYYAKAGFPKNEIEVMAMTEAFEPIALFHYERYRETSGVSADVLLVFKKIIEEEKHSGWITHWLSEHPQKDEVQKARSKYKEIIETVYVDELKRLCTLPGIVGRVAENAQQYIEKHGLRG